jgi:copper(I)-binding protein
LRRAILAAGLSLCAPAFAEITVNDAWVRGTVPGQSTTGAFMTITSSDNAKLVGAKSGLAAMAEIHTTTLKGGVNEMRPAPFVRLPAGKPVQLKPGGHHLMLMGIGKAFAAGDKVPILLTFENAKGERLTMLIRAEVRPLGK